MNVFLAIFAGGGLGAVSRYGTVTLLTRFIGPVFPFGTLAVNILGSFLAGCAVAFFYQRPSTDDVFRSFLIIGFLGGFTTFSAFSVDVFKAVEGGQFTAAAIYVVCSVVLSIAATFAGFYFLKWMGA